MKGNKSYMQVKYPNVKQIQVCTIMRTKKYTGNSGDLLIQICTIMMTKYTGNSGDLLIQVCTIMMTKYTGNSGDLTC
jgi:hypothetical protein